MKIGGIFRNCCFINIHKLVPYTFITTIPIQAGKDARVHYHLVRGRPIDPDIYHISLLNLDLVYDNDHVLYDLSLSVFPYQIQ